MHKDHMTYRHTENSQKDTYQSGFTLLELLVVIAIIGVLASIVLVSLDQARTKAGESTAKGELHNIRNGIMLLVNDTGKAPNGCSFGSTANPEVSLDTNQAGLIEQPNIQDNGSGCEWTASDVARWNGPYIETPLDPWGTSYRFDPDYYPYRHCSSESEQPGIQAIVAPGPDGSAAYTCDDIWIELR